MAKDVPEWMQNVRDDELMTMIPGYLVYMHPRNPDKWGEALAETTQGGGKMMKKKSAVKKAAKSAKKKAAKPEPNVALWIKFKGEFRKLLCTNDERYEATRKALQDKGNLTTLVAVSMISSAVSPYLGMATSGVIPLVAVGLKAVLQMGKNAICSED